jgi:hypothetical protein
MPVRVVGDIWHFPARSSNQLQRKRQQAADAILLRGDGQRAPIVSANDPLRVAMNFPMAPRMGGGIAPDLMAAGWTKKRVAPEGVDLVTCP